MANPSTETIIGIARDLMRAESGSDVPVVSDAFLFKVVSDIDREVKRAFRRGGGNSQIANALEWGASLASETAVNNSNGVATTDTTVTADSYSGYDTAGAFAIWTNDMPDVVFYTSRTTTLASGVTGIGLAHSDNDLIQPLYKLPSNFGQFRRSDDYGDGVQLNGNPLTYMEGPPRPGHFSTRTDGTSTFLWLPKGATGTVAALFDADSDEIDSLSDLIGSGPEWTFFYAWRCIELGVFGRGDYDLMQLAKQKGDSIKLDILKDRNIGRRVRIRPLSMARTHSDYLPDLEHE